MVYLVRIRSLFFKVEWKFIIHGFLSWHRYLKCRRIALQSKIKNSKSSRFLVLSLINRITFVLCNTSVLQSKTRFHSLSLYMTRVSLNFFFAGTCRTIFRAVTVGAQRPSNSYKIGGLPSGRIMTSFPYQKENMKRLLFTIKKNYM